MKPMLLKMNQMRGRMILVLFLIINLCVAFHQSPRFSRLFVSKWLRNSDVAVAKRKLTMASLLREPAGGGAAIVDEEPPVPPSKVKSYKPDLSSFAIGQQFQAKVVSTHPFGIFVDIAKGVNVLLPKSKLGKQYEQLKTSFENKLNETVKISLTDISHESGKIAGVVLTDRSNLIGDDASWVEMKGKDVVGKAYNTTVVSVHNFGLFVKVAEFNVQGLVPLSKLPVKNNLKDVYPVGSVIQVTVEDFSAENKKMVLSAVPRPDVRAFVNFPEEKWIQAVIQSVSSFGLFVRPAGYDVVGLVRRNQIPTDLLKTLRNILELDRRNQTVLEDLFGAGDVVRVRLASLDIDAGKVEFSMLPLPKDVDSQSFDEDDSEFAELKEIYGVPDEVSEEEESSSVSFSEEDFDPKSYRDSEEDEEEDAVAYADEDEEQDYDPLSTLVWWRGKPFTAPSDEVAEFDEDFDEDAVMEGVEEAVVASFIDAPFITESADMVQGAWRRLLNLDTEVADEGKQKEKDRIEDLKEIETEIGSMRGFDEDIAAELPAPFLSNLDTVKFGAFINFDDFPEWKETSSWYQTHEKPLHKVDRIRYGKKNMEEEWEKELDDLERSLKLNQPAVQLPVEQVFFEEPVSSTEQVIESIISGEESPAPPADAAAI